jgi:hypothetical protein
MGRDYQAFVAPDGRWVDLQHVMMGLDVLSRKEVAADYNTQPMGTNYAATTWAGDTGSAATEATMHRDNTTWERWNPSASETDRIQFYFKTRASDDDLLGDLDPWGMQHLFGHTDITDKIDILLASYYEDTKTNKGGLRTLIAQRRFALERFLHHYGFTYDPDTDRPNFPALRSQNKPVERILRETQLFAKAWLLFRGGMRWRKEEPQFVHEITDLFLYWLEYETIENGAIVQ